MSRRFQADETCVVCRGNFQSAPADPLYPLCDVCARHYVYAVADAPVHPSEREPLAVRLARWLLK